MCDLVGVEGGLQRHTQLLLQVRKALNNKDIFLSTCLALHFHYALGVSGGKRGGLGDGGKGKC